MRASRAVWVHMHLFVAFASYETQESTAASKMATDVTCNASSCYSVEKCHMPFKLMQAKPYDLLHRNC